MKLVDGAGGEQRVELGGHGARRLGVGGRWGEQEREHRREQGNRRAPHGADASVARSRSMQLPARLVLAFAALDQPQTIGAPAHPRPVSELAAAMRQVLGANRRYDQCLQDAGSDLAQAQACADLVGQ